MTLAHRIETVLAEDGKLQLDYLPFQAGQAVEVIVLPVASPTVPESTLQGKVVHYDRPTEPVADSAWNAAQ